MWHINRRLLPIKFHYFFFYGAMGGVMPFTPVLAKDLGINATAVGLIFTIVPFCVFFSKPLFGYLTDYFRNIRLIVFSLVSVTSLAYISMLLIPSIDSTEWTNVQLACAKSQPRLYLIPSEGNIACLKYALRQPRSCELSYRPCSSSDSVTLNRWTTTEDSVQSNTSLPSERYTSNSTIMLKLEPGTNITCDCIEKDTSLLRCVKLYENSCFVADNRNVFQTFQFWMLTLLAIISGTGAATVFCLSDAACCEVLGNDSQDFGRQRLWATISWGCVTLLAGFLNDVATSSSDNRTYSPGFYLMLSLVIVDLLLLMKIQLTKANFSLNICKDIGKIFSSCETVAFAVAVYITGGLTGFLWNYEFWYLQDLGATQTLLGLTIAVQCLAAEVPFFFFSGRLIRTFGHFTCVIGSFVAFTIRLGYYYFLQNPWAVLPIEIMHGVTFGVFYASMTSYASSNASPGTEATTLGILGGLYEGLGVATGSLLGGVGFDKLGGRNTFLSAGIISFICVPTFTIVHIIIKKFAPKRPLSLPTTDMSQSVNMCQSQMNSSHSNQTVWYQ